MRRAAEMLAVLLGGELRDVHAARRRSAFWAAGSLVDGGRLSVTGIGRSGADSTSPKHAIKRSWRLTRNAKLHADHPKFFKALLEAVVAGRKQVAVLVDWTKVGPFYALFAAIPIEGRAVPVCFEVHPEDSFGKPCVEDQFLERLATMFPSDCHGVLVTDAGFRSDWMLSAEKHGFDYITRIQGTSTVELDEGWLKVEDVARQAGEVPTDFEEVRLTKTRKLETRLVRAPKWVRKSLKRKREVSTVARKARKAAVTPWMLATSWTSVGEEAVVALYGQRMKIEALFRGHKSHRFGWCLRYARFRRVDRCANLLLVACLAAFVSTLIGRIAERNQLHRAHQANTARRRVLSLRTLASAVLRTHQHRLINTRRLRAELKRIGRERIPGDT